MSRQFNFYLFTTLALLQCSLGAIIDQNINTLFEGVPPLDNSVITLPSKSSIEDYTDSVTEYEPSEREKLYTYALDEYYQLAVKTLMNGKEMLKDIIGSLSILKGKNKLISAKVEEFSELISKVEEIEAQSEEIRNQHNYQGAFDLFDSFSKSLEACNVTAMENPSVADLLIDILLEKYGVSALDDIYWTDFWIFMHKMLVAAEQYWSNLSPEEQAEDDKFKDWLEQHREAENSDVNNKIQLYRKFFQLYQD